MCIMHSFLRPIQESPTLSSHLRSLQLAAQMGRFVRKGVSDSLSERLGISQLSTQDSRQYTTANRKTSFHSQLDHEVS